MVDQMCLCPCCLEGMLDVTLPETSQDPYKVSCPVCGTRFDHDLLHDGANGLVQFLMNIEPIQDDAQELKRMLCREAYVSQRGAGANVWYVCTSCGKSISPLDKYCKHCGAKLVNSK